MNNDLIKLLESYPGRCAHDKRLAIWADEIAPHIPELLEIVKGGWISVEKELPPKDKDLLVCNTRQGGVQCIAWWNRVHKRWDGSGGQTYLQFTHWQLKLNPPGEKEEE